MTKPNALLSVTHIKKLFNIIVDVVFGVILFFISLTMIIGVVRLFYRVGDLIEKDGITGSYLYIFADVLTLYILIELARSLIEYFISHQLRLTPIIDAGIVFVLRHIMIDLFQHKLDTQSIYALSVLLIALTAVRIGTTVSFERAKNKLPVSDQKKPGDSH